MLSSGPRPRHPDWRLDETRDHLPRPRGEPGRGTTPGSACCDEQEQRRSRSPQLAPYPRTRRIPDWRFLLHLPQEFHALSDTSKTLTWSLRAGPRRTRSASLRLAPPDHSQTSGVKKGPFARVAGWGFSSTAAPQPAHVSEVHPSPGPAPHTGSRCPRGRGW